MNSVYKIKCLDKFAEKKFKLKQKPDSFSPSPPLEINIELIIFRA